MEITERQAKESIKKVKSKTEWAKVLGFNYFNGKISNKLSDLIEKYKLDTSHFDLHHKNRKWQIITKICPVCEKEFETQENHPKEKTACSYSCSNTYFADLRYSKEANQKRRDSITKYLVENNKRVIKNKDSLPPKLKEKQKRKCKICETPFFPKRSKYKYCSKKCAYSFRDTKEYREKIRQAQLKLIEEGRHTGWQSRDKCKRSYAEEYVTKIFKKNGIIEGTDYEFEYRQDKWFIDFAFVEEKIAIEIDGKQHNYPERKTKDQEKDKYLEEQGWKVFRIKWRRPSLKTRKHLLRRLNEVLDVEIKDDTA